MTRYPRRRLLSHNQPASTLPISASRPGAFEGVVRKG
jgi:hypothetical protein